MVRVYTAKVNGHVTYFDAAKKPRRAIIIAVTSNTIVDLRVGHSGETHLGAARSIAPRTASSWANV